MSFLVQCFASKQTIPEGAKVWVAAVARTESFNPQVGVHKEKTLTLTGWGASMVSPACLWEPASMFISGVMRDCGQIQLLDTPNNRLVLFFLFHRLALYGVQFPVERGYDSTAVNFATAVAYLAPTLQRVYHTAMQENHLPPLDCLRLTELQALWDYLSMRIHLGRAFMGISGQFRPLAVAVLCDPAYARLLESGEKSERARGGRQVVMRQLLKTLLSKLKELPNQSLFAKGMLLNEEVRSAFRMTNTNLQEFNWGYHGVWQASAERMLDTGDVARMLRDVKEHLDGLYVVSALDELRCLFCPATYVGQDYGNDTGKRYAQFVDLVSLAMSEKHEEEL